MDTSKAQELKKLLDQAVSRMWMKGSSSNVEAIPVSAYRAAARSRIQFHRPGHTHLPMLYKPEIPDITLREKLSEFMEQELAAYLYEGRVQLGIFAIYGGPGSGFSIEDILDKLLEIAVVFGTNHAVEVFANSIQDQRCPFQEIALLTGLAVETEMRIYRGVKLVPLSKSTGDLPHYLPMMIGDNIPLTHFLGATLLIVDWFVFPRFLKPDEGYLSSAFDVNPFQRALREEEAPDFNLFEFCKALSLACDSMVTPSIQWSYIPDDELVNVRGAGGGFSYRNISSHGAKVRISDDQLQDAKRLYQALMELNPATKEKLEVPISRWIEPKVAREGSTKSSTWASPLNVSICRMPDRNCDLGLLSEPLGTWGLMPRRGNYWPSNSEPFTISAPRPYTQG